MNNRHHHHYLSRNRNTRNYYNQNLFSQELLVNVWHYMSNMRQSERNSFINHLQSLENNNTNHTIENNQETPPLTERRQLFTITTPFSRNDNDYIDFRLYPLSIDWNQIENGKTFYYNLYFSHGYFGVSLLDSLKKIKSKFQFKYESLYQVILEYYNTITVLFYDSLSIIEYIGLLPSISQLTKIITEGLFTKKELPLIQIVINIHEHYIFGYDHMLNIEMKEKYLTFGKLYYQTIESSDMIYIHNEIMKHKKVVKIMISFKMILSSHKENSIQRLSNLALDYKLLLQGNKEDMFKI